MALCIARDEETHEELVIYQAQYEQQYIWARPLDIFTEIIEYNGHKIPRFKLSKINK